MVVNGYCGTSCKWLSWVETTSAIFNMLCGLYLPENLYFPASASDLSANVFYKTWRLAYAKDIHLTWYKQKDVLTVIVGIKKKGIILPTN